MTKEALKRKSAGLGVFKAGAFQADAAEGFGEEIGRPGLQKAELVVEEIMAAGSAGKGVQLFFETVFHFAAGTIQIVIQLVRIAGQIGHEESGIGSLLGVLGLDEDATLAVPRFGAIAGGTEEANFLVRAF